MLEMQNKHCYKKPWSILVSLGKHPCLCNRMVELNHDQLLRRRKNNVIALNFRLKLHYKLAKSIRVARANYLMTLRGFGGFVSNFLGLMIRLYPQMLASVRCEVRGHEHISWNGFSSWLIFSLIGPFHSVSASPVKWQLKKDLKTNGLWWPLN